MLRPLQRMPGSSYLTLMAMWHCLGRSANEGALEGSGPPEGIGMRLANVPLALGDAMRVWRFSSPSFAIQSVDTVEDRRYTP
jgi:hypothetical protein